MKKDDSPQTEIDEKATVIVDELLAARRWVKFDIKPDYRIDHDIEPRKDGAITGNRTSVQQKGKARKSLCEGCSMQGPGH